MLVLLIPFVDGKKEEGRSVLVSLPTTGDETGGVGRGARGPEMRLWTRAASFELMMLLISLRDGC